MNMKTLYQKKLKINMELYFPATWNSTSRWTSDQPGGIVFCLLKSMDLKCKLIFTLKCCIINIIIDLII